MRTLILRLPGPRFVLVSVVSESADGASSSFTQSELDVSNIPSPPMDPPLPVPCTQSRIVLNAACFRLCKLPSSRFLPSCIVTSMAQRPSAGNKILLSGRRLQGELTEWKVRVAYGRNSRLITREGTPYWANGEGGRVLNRARPRRCCPACATEPVCSC